MHRGNLKGQILLSSTSGKVKLGEVYLAGVDGLRGERVSNHIESMLSLWIRCDWLVSVSDRINTSVRRNFTAFVLRLVDYFIIKVQIGTTDLILSVRKDVITICRPLNLEQRISQYKCSMVLRFPLCNL